MGNELQKTDWFPSFDATEMSVLLMLPIVPRNSKLVKKGIQRKDAAS